MQVAPILAGRALSTHEGWITVRGVVLRHELQARDTADAIERLFAIYPRAEAASARPLRPSPPGDALGDLHRRAGEAAQ